jgi:hypothetical protein
MSTASKNAPPAPIQPPTRTSINFRYLFAAVGAAAMILTGIVLLIAGIANKPASVPEVVGAPRAAVSTTLIDHGDVQMEDYAESLFQLKNTGDQVLVILDEPRVELVQGCCPPRAIVSDSSLEPGQEATISLRFTMHEMMGGPHEFRVHVPTNDPTQPMIVLTILSNWIE